MGKATFQKSIEAEFQQSLSTQMLKAKQAGFQQACPRLANQG
jgi:hypothetical protein